MSDICRLIVTEQCNRRCWYCCNKQEHIQKAMRPVTMDMIVGKYTHYIITGGEPLMTNTYDDTFSVICRLVESLTPQGKLPWIGVYTANATVFMPEILNLIDGITYSLHGNPDSHDIEMFHRFQKLLEFDFKVSAWLNIERGFNALLRLRPSLWDRIETFEPLDPCPIPEGEDLCILTERR